MQSKNVFVKPNLVVEPLVDKWYASSYLISPVTASLFFANHYLKMLQSFVSAPQVHIKALQERKMLGGPFIDYPAARVKEIRSLIDKTIAAHPETLRFAKGVRELNQLLAEKADGHTVEPLYSQVPEPLRGFVELVYDLNNAPSIRFMEGLLYHSRMFHENTQSVRLFLTESDGRPFAFNTPRLPCNDSMELPIPFCDPRLDDLHRARTEPINYQDLKNLLNIDEQLEETFLTFLTTSQPVAKGSFDGEGLRVRYFGHACILLETRNLAILCDPVIGYSYEHGADRYTYEDLPEKLDYILITHNHHDHCLIETLLQLRPKTEKVMGPKNNPGALQDPSLKMMLKSIGFKQVYEIDEMEVVDVVGGSIRGIPFLGEHGDVNIHSKIAFCVELEGQSVIMAADSNNLDARVYRNLVPNIPQVDALFIGLECEGAPLSWAYGPMLMNPVSRSMDQSRRFDGSDCEKAMQIVDILKPKHAYVYAMGLEPWLTFMIAVDDSETSHSIQESGKFVGLCRELDIESERMFCKKEIVLTSD